MVRDRDCPLPMLVVATNSYQRYKSNNKSTCTSTRLSQATSTLAQQCPDVYLISGEGKELIVHISLHLLTLIHGRAQLLPIVGQSTDVLVEVKVHVIMGPEGLPVVGVVASVKRLLCPVVDYGYAL